MRIFTVFYSYDYHYHIYHVFIGGKPTHQLNITQHDDLEVASPFQSGDMHVPC